MTNGRWRPALAALLTLALAGTALPAAANASAPATFEDDFDTLGAPWVEVAGDWEATDGAARVVTAGTSRGSQLALSGLLLEPESTITTTFQTEGGGTSAWAGVTVHRGVLEDDYTESGYTVLLRNSGELVVIAAAGASAVEYLGNAPTDARPQDAPVTLDVTLDGQQLDVAVDGVPTLSVADSRFDNGGLTLASHRDLKMVVDRIAIDGIVEGDDPTPPPGDCRAWSGEPETGAERGVVLNSDARIDAVAQRVADGTEPQAGAAARLMDEIPADLARTPAPPTTFFVPFFYNNSDAHRAARDGLQNDANAAYRLALAYRLTGDLQYGTHAAAFLDAWTSTVECVRTAEDSALAFSYHFPAFIHAAELLRGTDAWSADGEALFAGFVRETAVAVAASILSAQNNWGSWALETTTASAAYLADTELLATANTRAVELIEHQIDENGHMPDEVSRNNGVGDYGIWYTHFSMLPLMLSAETLAAHGYDLFGYTNAQGTGLADAAAAVAGWVNDPETFAYFTGDTADLANVRTIDYLREAGTIAHSMSYFELTANHYPSELLDSLLAEEGPMTTIHSAPYLTLTHGAMLEPDEPVAEALVETDVTARCVGGITLVLARTTNVSDERLDVSVSFDDKERSTPRLRAGRTDRDVFVTTRDTGELQFAATAEDGREQTGTGSFDVAPCTFDWLR